MKMSIFTFALILLFGCNAYAQGNWTAKDYALQSTSSALIVADWLQTREIATDNNYTEINYILGDNPKLSEVNQYFAGCLIGQFLISYALSHKYRNYWQGIIITMQAGVVAHNYNMGIKIKF